jgi:tetratricopeptide (TPR) repeat protein
VNTPAVLIIFSVSLALPAGRPAGGDAPPLRPAEIPATRPGRSIDKAIDELGDADAETREAASHFLWQQGEASRAALRTAAESHDPEVAARAGGLLADLPYAAFPGAPRAVYELVRAYRTTDPADRAAVIDGLYRSDAAGYGALIRLYTDQGPDGRQQILSELRPERPRPLVATAMILGETAFAEARLAELAIAPSPGSAPHDYAAYLLTTGGLERGIREMEARQAALVPQANDGEARRQHARVGDVLARLYHAKGDRAAALRHALGTLDAGGGADGTDYVSKELVAEMRVEAEEWKALAAYYEACLAGDDSLTHRNLAACFHLLANDQPALHAALQRLRRDAHQPRTERPEVVWYPLHGLILTGHVEDVVEYWRGKGDLVNLFWLLAQLGRPAEALALLERAPARPASERYQLAQMSAHVYHRLGEMERAAKASDQAGALLRESWREYRWPHLFFSSMVQLELKLGRRDRATAYAIEGVAHEAGFPDAIVNVLYRDDEGAATIWWSLFREAFKGEPAATTLARIASIYEGTAAATDINQWVAEAERIAARRDGAQRERGHAGPGYWTSRTAHALLAARRPDRAEACLKEVLRLRGPRDPWGVVDPLMELGAIAAAGGRWADAAEFYRRAWESSTSAKAAFLCGRALSRAGRADEAAKWDRAARVIPLANPGARWELAAAMQGAGLPDEADRQDEVLWRTGEFKEMRAETWHRGAEAAAGRRDYAAAARLGRRAAIHECFTGSGTRPETTNRLIVLRQQLDAWEARVLIDKGDAAGATRATQAALALSPDGVQAVGYVVMRLAARGKAAEADRLYGSVRSRLADVIREFPRFARAQHLYAGLALASSRDPADALEHAREAARLEPRNAKYLDTLAEAYARLGRRDEAVAQIKRCLELGPNTPYYQARMKELAAPPAPAAVSPTTPPVR